MIIDGQASGGAIPFTGNPSGGLRLLTGDRLITQYVRTYARDCESDNPFQDLGIGLRPIFQVANGPAWRADARARIKDMFDNYLEPSNLARLDRVEFSDDDDGGVIMAIWFISIESEERRSVEIPVLGAA